MEGFFISSMEPVVTISLKEYNELISLKKDPEYIKKEIINKTVKLTINECNKLLMVRNVPCAIKLNEETNTISLIENA